MKKLPPWELFQVFAMKFDAIIFDLDGTLWDSREGIAASWNETVAAAGGARFTLDDISSIMGLTGRAIAERLFAAFGETRYALCEKCMHGEIAYLRAHGAQVYNGVEAMLSALSARTPLFLVSNCQADYAEVFFELTGFAPYFKDCLTEGHTGLKKAENIRLLIERHGLRRAVYVGDTALDEQSAREAGCAFIHAEYGFGAAASPDGRIADPAALLALIDELEAEP